MTLISATDTHTIDPAADVAPSDVLIGDADPTSSTISTIGHDDDPGTSFARCADGHGTLSHLFFSEDAHELARAKAICRPCGLRESCLAGAIERQEPYGVWGGKLVLDGVPVEVKRKRGRPRKNPLPVLVVDEVPIPEHLIA